MSKGERNRIKVRVRSAKATKQPLKAACGGAARPCQSAPG